MQQTDDVTALCHMTSEELLDYVRRDPTSSNRELALMDRLTAAIAEIDALVDTLARVERPVDPPKIWD